MDNRIFHVTIKGLYFRATSPLEATTSDAHGAAQPPLGTSPTAEPPSRATGPELLLIQEKSGGWELPGGRLEHGEDFHTALQRECQEEMGVPCDVLDKTPYWAWSTLGGDGIWKVVLCFRIALPHLDFTRTDECAEWGFFDANSVAGVKLTKQLQPLLDHLRCERIA